MDCFDRFQATTHSFNKHKRSPWAACAWNSRGSAEHQSNTLMFNLLSRGPVDLLILQPTPFCNLDCSYCYLPNRTLGKKMPIEIVRAVGEKIMRCRYVEKSFTVVWHSGEPLAAGLKWYQEAVAALDFKRRGLEVDYSVQTNGSLINDDWCEFFKEHDFKVGVSIDGPAFLHDRNRKTRGGKGSHSLVMAGIEALHRAKLDCHVISVITAESLEHPVEFLTFFKEIGIKSIGFNFEEKEDYNKKSSLDSVSGVDARVRQFLTACQQLNQSWGSPLRIRELENATALISTWTEGRERVLPLVGTQENSLFRLVSVDWEGNFSTFSPELLGANYAQGKSFSFGNILTGEFDDALKNPVLKEVEQEIRAGIKQCRDKCKYFGFCGGGSPANKFFENKTFNSTETLHCRLHNQAPLEVVFNSLKRQSVIRA